MYSQRNNVNDWGLKRENSIDNYARIVKASIGGIKKTRLMSEAGLSFTQLNGVNRPDKNTEGYLKEVLLYRLIEPNNGDYWTTEEGKGFLKHYHKMRSYLKPGYSPKFIPSSKLQSTKPIVVKQKKNGKNRTFYDIIARCVEVSINGMKKTKLMYDAGLNNEKLKEYRNILTRLGLMLEEDNKLWATEKGIEFLEAYKITKNYLRDPSEVSVSMPVPQTIMPNGNGGFVKNFRQFS